MRVFRCRYFGVKDGAMMKLDDVHIRNSDAPRHLKPQLNLVFRKNLARIQAAGVNGFVKGSSTMHHDTEPKPAEPALKR
jgi:hypothetical protein